MARKVSVKRKTAAEKAAEKAAAEKAAAEKAAVKVVGFTPVSVVEYVPRCDPRYISVRSTAKVGRDLYEPFQNRHIPLGEVVELRRTSWVLSQIEAKLLEEVLT